MADIWVPAVLLNEMKSLASASWPLETGGMLVGYTADNLDIVVTEIIGPGPGATHQRSYFEPDAEYQQALLEQHYLASQGRETYLGDWHTHPDSSNELSSLDKRTLREIASTTASGTKNPVMMILGGSLPSLAVNPVQYRKAFFLKALPYDQYAPLKLKIFG